MLREGQQVTYIGEPRDGLVRGDAGKVLTMASDDSGHVMWSTGAQTGNVTLEFDYDLEGPRTRQARAHIDLLADSLEVGTIVSTSLREAYDSAGAEGLLSAMAEEGHLASMHDIAEEAMELIAGRIRQDPSFRAVVAELDPEESEHLIRLAAVGLIHEAFGTEE